MNFCKSGAARLRPGPHCATKQRQKASFLRAINTVTLVPSTPPLRGAPGSIVPDGHATGIGPSRLWTLLSMPLRLSTLRPQLGGWWKARDYPDCKINVATF
jgi:hypothetical protein